MQVSRHSSARPAFKGGRTGDLACLIALVTACGGGGGVGDLAVSFFFANFSSPLFPTQSQAVIGGLNSNTRSGPQHCRDPTQTGTFTATITRTASGFKGSVSTLISIGVEAPVLTAIGGPSRDRIGPLHSGSLSPQNPS